MILINKSNLNTIKRYYLPLWILRNPKTGTSEFAVNLFKFVKPIENKVYIKRFGITYNLGTTNMSILNAESNTGIQLTLTKPEILWTDSNKKFLDKIKMLKPLLHN